jgi:hypothetical protein
MSRHMRHRRSLSCGVGRFPRGAAQVSGSAHRVAGGGTGLSHRNFTSRPGTRQLDCSARTVITRSRLLEEVQHMLGAVGSPYRQQVVMRIQQRATATNSYEPRISFLR